eukprot:4076009-Pyramimonas_sp.AAC.1
MSVRCYYYHYHSYCLRTASCAPWTSRVSSRHAASGSTCCARDTTKTFTTTKYMTTSSGSKINCAHREGYDTPGKLPVASTPAASRVGGNIRKGIRVASRSDTFKLATKTRDATGGVHVRHMTLRGGVMYGLHLHRPMKDLLIGHI